MGCKLQVALLLLASAALAQVGDTPDQTPRYFPTGIFAQGNSDGGFQERWYGEQLRALKEPSLLETAPSRDAVYRFTWLRTFHHPIAVRITVRANGTATLTARMSDGTGGYAPGMLIANTSREVGAPEVRHALDLIDAMGFWQVSTESPPSDEVTLDGAQWILEAASQGRYHVIDRCSPRAGSLRELGLYLAVTLAKLDVPAKTIY